MAITVTEISTISGATFTAKLNQYADSITLANWYTLDGVRVTGTVFRFILAPLTSLDLNPLNWAAGYVRLLDSYLAK